MDKNDAHPAGEPTMKNGPEVENLSGQVPTVGSTIRPPQHRDAYGRYRRRGTTLIRGLPAPGSERTELFRDAVSGKAFRRRNNSALFRHDAFGMEPVHYASPDFSGHPPLSALMDDGAYPRHLRREV